MQHYYLKTATDELVFTEDQFDSDNAPQVVVKRNGTFRLRGAVTLLETKGYSIDGGVTKLTNNAYKNLTPAQLATVVPFINPRKVRLIDALYLAGWDGVAPYVDVIVSAGYDPFAAVMTDCIDPITHVNTPIPVVPGIPFAGWPQTAANPAAPIPEDPSIDVSRKAKKAAQDAWRDAARVQATLGMASYAAWFAANPFPA